MDCNWVRNAWYVAGWSHDLGADHIEARTIIDQPLALYRKRDGEIVALEDRCCHRFAPLSIQRLEQDDPRCMYHGLKFAPDGRCIEIPGQKLIPHSAFVRRYPAVERGGWIWIWMGDEVVADLDNLLDLSHLTFAHEKTLGLDMPQWADERPRIVPLRAIIEAQQKSIDLEPSRRMLPTSLDAGPTRFRRLVQSLLDLQGQTGRAATARSGP